jgi:hypothetical protein
MPSRHLLFLNVNYFDYNIRLLMIDKRVELNFQLQMIWKSLVQSLNKNDELYLYIKKRLKFHKECYSN